MASDKTPPTYLEAAPKDPPRNPELEKIILENPDEHASYLVYADWLTQHGDPRGELIVVQSQGKEDREKELLAANGDFMRGVGKGGREWMKNAGSGVADVKWRWGFWESLKIMNVIDWMDSKFPVKDVFDRLFSNPASIALKEIKVGVIRWEYNGQDVKLLIEEAAKQPFAKNLQALRLGECNDIDIDCAHHSVGDLSAVSASFPNLREFTLWGHDFVLGKLDLPKLRTLKVETCGLSNTDLESVATGNLPSLEHLDLWFGSEDYGNDNSVDSLASIFEGKQFPKLKHLGLMNCPFTDEICQQIGNAKILKQLTELDLSMGTMSDVGARALIDNASAFKHLKKIDVSDSYLTEETIEELKKLGPEIVAEEMREDESEEGEDYRYVSVAE